MSASMGMMCVHQDIERRQEIGIKIMDQLDLFVCVGAGVPVLDVARPVGLVGCVGGYIHPVSGDTWSGRGRPPLWVRVAVDVEGIDLASMRVGGAS